MISFFIDTALSYVRLVLFKDNEIIDSVEEYCDKDLSQLFSIYVRTIIERNNIKFNDIDKIYAVTGPGSFTGIRIGLTFSKILGMSINKNIIPISELEVLASTNVENKKIVPLIDARRGYVYTGMYDENLNNIVNDKYILLDEFLKKINTDNVTFISYNNFDTIDIIKPSIDYKKIIKKNYNKLEINYNELVPNYLKNTEAEENLRKKLQNDSKIL